MPRMALPLITVVVNNGVRYDTARELGTITNSYDIVCKVSLDRQEVGRCEAKLFNAEISDTTALGFWKRMRGLRVRGSRVYSSTEPINEPERLAFDLFDHNGKFRKKFYRHEVAKGKGRWDSNLELGQILLVEIFYVDPERRGSNIESQMFQRLLEMATNGEPGSQEESSKTKSTVGTWAFTRVGILHGVASDARYTRQNTFRSLGFRRVGNSEWFAYSPDPNHPSRQLQADDDLEITCSEPFTLSSSQADLFAKVSNRNTPDEESEREISSRLAPENVPEDYWLAARARNGDTLLHSAAKAFKPRTVEYLLFKKPSLERAVNAVGYTPYQALEEEIEKLWFPFTAGSIENGKVLPARCPRKAEDCLRFLEKYHDGGQRILQYSG